MSEQAVTRIIVGGIATNCWIYPLADTVAAQGLVLPHGFQGCAVIDPGEEAPRISACLHSMQLVPVYILLTHGHFDHIAGLPSLVTEYTTLLTNNSNKFPLIAIHRDDAGYLGPDSYQMHYRSFTAAAGSSEYIDTLWEDMPPPDLILEEGAEIGPFTVLHLPGHTPGSIALWEREAGILFTGDTLFKASYGRTDLPGGNEQQILASLNRLFAMDKQIKIYPGHGPASTIGQEAGAGKSTTGKESWRVN